MTPLDKTLKRAIRLNGADYVITLSPDALKLSRKGHRLGIELKWTELLSGDTALAVALQASLGQLESGAKTSKPAAPARKPRADSSASAAKSARKKTPLGRK